MRTAPKRAALAAAITALLALALTSASPGEVVRQGNLQGSFNGGISPEKLPRTELAPVAVTMGGKIATTDRTTPPKLERIVLAINSHGALQTKGKDGQNQKLGAFHDVTPSQGARGRWGKD